ncbi:8001_t:CDS:2 [Ambispora leptoticha]|uniref:8001_t:CDS:1 n=1 Tax=Ambispora leptoticha TaxID=144679 RepID=A0A9N8WL14_9GLOM|nr:8001_t:CDS:2 [Ambispora leptoticha]
MLCLLPPRQLKRIRCQSSGESRTKGLWLIFYLNMEHILRQKSGISKSANEWWQHFGQASNRKIKGGNTLDKFAFIYD